MRQGRESSVRFDSPCGSPCRSSPRRFARCCGVGSAALVCAGVGLLYWLPAGIGTVLGGVLLFIPLILGLVMAILLVGLLAGWPLMHASVAAEADDTLDALSRSFSYLNQRLGKFAGWLASPG